MINTYRAECVVFDAIGQRLNGGAGGTPPGLAKCPLLEAKRKGPIGKAAEIGSE